MRLFAFASFIKPFLVCFFVPMSKKYLLFNNTIFLKNKGLKNVMIEKCHLFCTWSSYTLKFVRFATCHSPVCIETHWLQYSLTIAKGISLVSTMNYTEWLSLITTLNAIPFLKIKFKSTLCCELSFKNDKSFTSSH